MPAVARALFGEPDEKHGGGKNWRWGKKGSLSVNVEKGVFTDHETGDTGGAYDLIRRETGLTGAAVVDWLRRECPGADVPEITRAEQDARRKKQAKERRDRDKWAADKAAEIWRGVRPAAGTLAETYLAGRDLSAAGQAFIRCAPDCWHGGLKQKIPAMIGGVTVWPGDEVRAVHRTFLAADGGKLTAEGHDAKMMLGPVSGGAVRLSGAGDTGGPLILCEGIETGLSLAAAGVGPVWAALSAGGIKAVVLPPPARGADSPCAADGRAIAVGADNHSQDDQSPAQEMGAMGAGAGNPRQDGKSPAAPALDHAPRVIIAADHDKAGRDAAETRAAALVRAGYAVSVVVPPDPGQDFNDLHRAAGIEAVRRVLTGAQPFGTEPPARLLNSEGWPFYVNEKGVFYTAERTNKDGDAVQDVVRLSTPIHVEAITQAGDGTGWGRMVCVVSPTGQRNRTILTAADIAEGARAGVFRVLSSLGATLPAGARLRDRLLDYLMEAQPDRQLIAADRTGWHDETGAFVLPDASFQDDLAGPSVVYHNPASSGARSPYQVKGTLAEWKEQIAKPCRWNSRLVFALSVACVGPLMRLIGGEGGVFHFSGPSSIGKSTMLTVAGSFWGGGGLHGFRDTWRATDNALESKAQEHSDTLICLDELGQSEAGAAQRAVYMLAQGAGKSRMDKGGAARALSQWRISALSTGEIGMLEKLAEGRGAFVLKDGQEARFVEIPADADAEMGICEVLNGFASPAALSEHFKAAAMRCYGAPARAYLEKLVPDRVRVEGLAQENIRRMRGLLAKKGASPAVDRVAHRFALAATAGALAWSYGILPFTRGEIDRAALTCFEAWIRARGGAGSAETYQAARRVRSFIDQYGGSRFQDFDNTPPHPVQSRSGFRREQPGGSQSGRRYEYFFLSSSLRSVLEGLNFRASIKGMAADGLLVGVDGSAAAVIRVPSERGTFRLYPVSDKLFDQD
ncbi:MAG: DUF927 domain-containing protein [Paracoccus sp. (in: a-proteobacteria)]|uniref:TOPRIM and DUF927 domain-containing protein n=1 Tax=Paracoccus sp. TaxID=267 RepID=UPI0026DF99A9|nr:DUF927 domain-containing protein [Paracoccus sp. (in: a-proteobacteria)]MDO5631638.1 DUF927 domain-containing protein [Paracoccus sp. (in: a-proteobacteria)]